MHMYMCKNSQYKRQFFSRFYVHAQISYRDSLKHKAYGCSSLKGVVHAQGWMLQIIKATSWQT
jgi:hypothetical protein